jgi:hypothetical protein
VGALTRYWLPNTTTLSDVLVMLQKISAPSYTTPELSAETLDLMANTGFEDRLSQSLPKGRGSRARWATTEVPSSTQEWSSPKARTMQGTPTYFIVVKPAPEGKPTALSDGIASAAYRT